MISIQNLFFRYGHKNILQDINLQINKCDFWAIFGANGTGKTTLLKLMAKQLEGYSGTILLNDKKLNDYKQKEIASIIGYMPQKILFSMPYTVREFLEISMYSNTHINKETNAYQETLQLFKLQKFENNLIYQLSGGELQRLLLASVYIQETEIICLDEPLNFLDPAFTQLTMSILDTLYFEKQKTIVMVMQHWQSLYFSKIFSQVKVLMLKDNKIYFSGAIKEALPMFEDYFEVKLNKIKDGNTQYLL